MVSTLNEEEATGLDAHEEQKRGNNVAFGWLKSRRGWQIEKWVPNKKKACSQFLRHTTISHTTRQYCELC